MKKKTRALKAAGMKMVKDDIHLHPTPPKEVFPRAAGYAQFDWRARQRNFQPPQLKGIML